MSITLFRYLPEERPPYVTEECCWDQHRDRLKLFQMPGREWHIISEAPLRGIQLAYVQGADPDDLFGLALWADAVHRDGGTPHAFIPYLPGARQDRRRPGEALSAKVYADFLNNLSLATVVCADPHSDVMPALIERCIIVPVERLMGELSQTALAGCSGVIIPDAGGVRRAEAAAVKLRVPAYQALKHRDMATGKLSGFSCEKLPDLEPQEQLLVVDDICDGGGTFMGLAKALGIPKRNLILWATHGVFKDGCEELVEHYDWIFTTDSHPGGGGWRYKHKFTDRLTVGPAFPALDEAWQKGTV